MDSTAPQRCPIMLGHFLQQWTLPSPRQLVYTFPSLFQLSLPFSWSVNYLSSYCTDKINAIIRGVLFTNSFSYRHPICHPADLLVPSMASLLLIAWLSAASTKHELPSCALNPYTVIYPSTSSSISSIIRCFSSWSFSWFQIGGKLSWKQISNVHSPLAVSCLLSPRARRFYSL